MFKLIKKLFIKDYANVESAKVRVKYGSVAGFIGILTNLSLFAVKLIIGVLTFSISIIADAINNLSDAGSSLITMFGFKMSSRPADSEHPYGHARYEYISGLVIAFIIIAIGIELGISSIEKIISGEKSSYDLLTIIILSVAIIVKLWQCFLYRNFGKSIKSATLLASSTDSRNDVITTSAVLASVIFTYITGIVIDGYVGVAVSVFILISSLGLIKDTINPLIGVAPDKELVKKLKEILLSHKDVLGLHDLVIHTYGASLIFATVHAEVDANSSMINCHDSIDNIEREVADKLNVNLVIHMDPVVFNDEEANKLKILLNAWLKEIDPRISMHGLRLVHGPTHINVLFDAVVPFEVKITEAQLKEYIDERLDNLDKTYYSVIMIDRNYIEG